MSDHSTLPAGMTPRCLTKPAAAAYVGMSPEAFEARVRPHVPPLDIGSRPLLWDVRALDRWLDELSGLVEAGPLGNPLAGQRGIKIARPRDLPRANRPWSQDEAAAIFAEAYPGLRLALGLAYYAGMRGGDIVRVTWTIYDGERLEWKQGKTGDAVSLPALSELRAILDAAPRIAPTIATNTYGRPMTEAGLRKAFRLLILRLLRAGRVAPGLTLHGCRHTLGDELANLGAEPRMIQAVLGHRSMSASLHYSQGADRKRAAAAAVHLLETRGRRRP